jgi:uncharacterized membrane protein
MPTRNPIAPVTPANRIETLDAVRGAAMVWMMAFHLLFDLNMFGLLSPKQNFFGDPLWTWQRTCIVSLFLLCAGAGQALALQAAQGARRFWQRWAQVAGCAGLVSLGSWWMFPGSWISFGVLHGIAVMLPLLRWTAPLGHWRWPLALVCGAFPFVWQHEVFNGRWLNWTGLVSRLPVTMDFVPVLPWFGMMLMGALLVPVWQAWHSRRSSPNAEPLAQPWRALATLGRWPLTVYMLHQPVFIGALYGWRALSAG